MISEKSDGNELKLKHIINPLMIHDPTLPKVRLPCPECKNSVDTSDTIAYRFNEVDISYVYICRKCEHYWKIDDNVLK